jgi:hypothetical protein
LNAAREIEMNAQLPSPCLDSSHAFGSLFHTS